MKATYYFNTFSTITLPQSILVPHETF